MRLKRWLGGLLKTWVRLRSGVDQTAQGGLPYLRSTLTFNIRSLNSRQIHVSLIFAVFPACTNTSTEQLVVIIEKPSFCHQKGARSVCVCENTKD